MGCKQSVIENACLNAALFLNVEGSLGWKQLKSLQTSDLWASEWGVIKAWFEGHTIVVGIVASQSPVLIYKA